MHRNDVRIRPAVPADAAACVRIRGLTRENPISAERLASEGITIESWGRTIADGSLPGVVATAGEGIAGYCFGARQTGEVVVLALLPEYEGHGLGRRLLREVVALLCSAGHRRLFLGSSADPRCRAHGFYRHLGWRSTGALDGRGDELLELWPLGAPSASDRCAAAVPHSE